MSSFFILIFGISVFNMGKRKVNFADEVTHTLTRLPVEGCNIGCRIERENDIFKFGDVGFGGGKSSSGRSIGGNCRKRGSGDDDESDEEYRGDEC